jgi:hypothetical protein
MSVYHNLFCLYTLQVLSREPVINPLSVEQTHRISVEWHVIRDRNT